jgi:hypothetical protein
LTNVAAASNTSCIISLLLLLLPGADPNYVNGAGDLTLFWAIDGGAATIKLLIRCVPALFAVLR